MVAGVAMIDSTVNCTSVLFNQYDLNSLLCSLYACVLMLLLALLI